MPRQTAHPITDYTLALTPRGLLRLQACDSTEARLPAAAARGIHTAFARGQGHGLFHLGAVEATRTLPLVWAFWRDLGRTFLTALCSVRDLEEPSDDLHLPAPQDAFAELLEAEPPMIGGEYLSAKLLGLLWLDMEIAFGVELQESGGTVQEFLKQKNPAWSIVGRVHFHLAEHKSDAATPFAFLATYTTRLGHGDKAQHKPLGKALQEYAGAGNKQALLALLRPVRDASEHSGFLRQLVDSKDVFHPLGWSPTTAYEFLRDIPIFEANGIIVRVPDWWQPGRHRRPEVQVDVGGAPPAGLGLDALLDFSVSVVVDGKPLSGEELQQILASTAGLAKIRGQWVEIDSRRLQEVLDHWQAVAEHAVDGLSFVEGMRLLSGATLALDPGAPDEEVVDAWSKRQAGDWLKSVLADLQRPEPRDLDLDGDLHTSLRPYQEVGVGWLLRLSQLRLGACLADDMGLGKTIQILALLLFRKRQGAAGTSLLIVPASLIGNWQSEIDRFAPGLDVMIAHPSVIKSKDLRDLRPEQIADHDLVITSYGFLTRVPWTTSFAWDLAILDEAQAIKNPSAKQTRATKKIESRSRIALTGTPVENRLADLWSIFDFLNPGLLGSAKVFKSFANKLAECSRHAYAPLRRLISPYILRRLKTDQSVIADLPDKIELTAWCSLTKTQAALYQESVNTLARQLKTVDGMQRRGMVLAFLTRFKQICNHPSQWLGDGDYKPDDSGKFGRLRELCETLTAKQEKVLVFTQYREMTAPLVSFLARAFGSEGLVLHGQVPVRKRADIVRRFQEDEALPFLVLSLKAGGTGLNLTAASQVIHFDRWWNPAVENQATDRAFRIGQEKNVLVHKFVCRGTVEEKIASMLEDKQKMSDEILDADAGPLLTEMDDGQLLEMVSLDINSALSEA